MITSSEHAHAKVERVEPLIATTVVAGFAMVARHTSRPILPNPLMPMFDLSWHDSPLPPKRHLSPEDPEWRKILLKIYVFRPSIDFPTFESKSQ